MDDGITDFAPLSHPVKVAFRKGKVSTPVEDQRWWTRKSDVEMTDRFEELAYRREEDYKKWCEENGHEYVRGLPPRRTRKAGRKNPNPKKVIVTPVNGD